MVLLVIVSCLFYCLAMPRQGKVFKRCTFKGNRYCKHSGNSDSLETTGQHSDEISLMNQTVDSEVRASVSSSSSKRKLSNFSSNLTIPENDSARNNIIVDFNTLSTLISGFVKCQFCDGVDCVTFVEDKGKRQGLATGITIQCSKYDEKKAGMTSNKLSSRLHEINVRFMYALRSIGKGAAAGGMFCAIMNLPSPRSRFSSIYKNAVLNAVNFVGEQSMIKATHEAISENNGDINIAAAFDGKREDIPP